MKPLLVYCYDPYCVWSYGFSAVLKNIADEYKNRLEVEVLSGGMVLPEKPVHIEATAEYMLKTYPLVEKETGVTFGQDFLWHIKNPGESDWYPNSEMPAIALVIFKEIFPDGSLAFASDMQYALFYEGRDLTDKEAYRHLLEKYGIDAGDFYKKLQDPVYRDYAREEFETVKRLKVTGFPAVFIQATDQVFHEVARGFTTAEVLKERIDATLK